MTQKKPNPFVARHLLAKIEKVNMKEQTFHKTKQTFRKFKQPFRKPKQPLILIS